MTFVAKNGAFWCIVIIACSRTACPKTHILPPTQMLRWRKQKKLNQERYVYRYIAIYQAAIVSHQKRFNIPSYTHCKHAAKNTRLYSNWPVFDDVLCTVRVSRHSWSGTVHVNCVSLQLPFCQHSVLLNGITAQCSKVSNVSLLERHSYAKRLL